MKSEKLYQGTLEIHLSAFGMPCIHLKFISCYSAKMSTKAIAIARDEKAEGGANRIGIPSE